MENELIVLRPRLRTAEAAGKQSEEAAAALQQRLAGIVANQESTAQRHAEAYLRLRSAYAARRGISLASRVCTAANAENSFLQNQVHVHDVILCRFA